MKVGTLRAGTSNSLGEDAQGGRSRSEPAASGRRRSRLEVRLAALLLLAPLLGAAGVVAAELVPDTRIADQLVEAHATGVLPESGLLEQTPLGTAPARYTECTSFSLGLGDRPGAGLFDRAMLSPAYTGCGRLTARLDTYGDTEALEPGTPYLRYWHGYAVISRPTLALAGVRGTRWVAIALSGVAIAALAVAVRRRWGTGVALVLVGPAILTTDTLLGGLSATTAWGGACAWLGGWLTFTVVEARPAARAAALAGAVAGALTAYGDLMTTMPGARALAGAGAALGAATPGREGPARGAWRLGGIAMAGWLVGLAWMWASKWIIAAAVLGIREVDETVRTQIAFRVSGDSRGTTGARSEGIMRNLRMWWEQPWTPWVVLGAVGGVAVLVVLALRRRPWRAVSWSLLLFAVGSFAVTLAWYAALNNHSQIHPQLVYRSLPLSLGASAAMAVVALRREAMWARAVPAPAGPYGEGGDRPA